LDNNLFDHMNLFADCASNHRGDKAVFMQLWQDIKAAGAIPKIQLFSEETFPREWEHLFYEDMGFIASVFQPADVDFIMPYKPMALKVASVEATYWKLIERCCQEDLPLIVSTGGMDEEEIGELLEATQSVKELCLMHCVSLYPTPREKINLGRLARLSEDLEGDDRIVIGWSSHYPMFDHTAFALAWAWGATQFEVHVRPNNPFINATLDEQCAFTPEGLKHIRAVLEDFSVLEGSDDYAGPDRDFVLQHRGRWNAQVHSPEGERT
jgi:sialic acid synthase SpsE